MVLLLRQRVALLATLLVVILWGRTAESLRCYCSDCNLNQFCYGDICYTQIFLDVQSGVVSERWRCLNTTRLCDISTVITAYACCNTHDMCNRNLHATLGGNSEEERTSNLTNKTSNLNNRTSNLNTTMCTNLTEIANSTMGQNESIVFENSTLQCNETSRNETTPSRNETTPPLSETTPTTIEIESFTPTVPPGGTFECRVAETTNPHTFNFTFCETNQSCFISYRLRNGRPIYKWGCTRNNGPCIEENRNRKKKTCCHYWFCNGIIPSDWLDEDDVTTPLTTPPIDLTRPPAANLSTAPPTDVDKPNCTVAESTTINLSPCVGPGSVPDLVPSKTEPVPNGPGTGHPPSYICYCNTCEDQYWCQSPFGCASTYTFVYDIFGIRAVIGRFCIEDEAYFRRCGVATELVCCLDNMCNVPHVTNVTAETTPTTPTTEPITAATGTHQTEANCNDTTSPTNQTTVNPSTPESFNPSEATESDPTSLSEDVLYSLCAVLSALLVVLILVMILCVCCYVYRKRLHDKSTSSSQRSHRIAMATRWDSPAHVVRGVLMGSTLEERYASCSEKMPESPNIVSSCNTNSTCTQSSSPESTV